MDAHDELLKWASKRGVELHGVEPQRIPERGIGMIATERVEVRDPFCMFCLIY